MKHILQRRGWDRQSGAGVSFSQGAGQLLHSDKNKKERVGMDAGHSR